MTDSTNTSLYKDEEAESSTKVTAYRRIEKLFKPEFKTRGKNKKLVKIPLTEQQWSHVIQFPSSSGSDVLDVSAEVLRHATTYLDYFSQNEQLYSQYMNHPSEWKIFSLKSIRGGFYFIKNVFRPEHEYYWAKRCLKDYPKAPNKTNMDLHLGGPQSESIWNLYYDATMRNDTKQIPKLHKQLHKTTWCTLGYQYEWTSRKYIRSSHAPFPRDASLVCSLIANVTGVHPYTPEAAIVNFYHENMTMGGHKDESEETMAKPIVSVSFGSSAIYLLGGETRDETPRAILIESGDVMVLGGEAREWYHGIARIVENSCKDYWNPKHFPADSEMHHIAKLFFEENRRINMNVRQVYDDEEEQMD